MAELYQLFVKLLEGKHKTLNFTTPSVSAMSVKHRLCDITGIPIQHQRLISNGRQLEDQTLISIDGSHMFPTVHLLLRLRGGKGGFGSLLRGAATKAGQKKTNNFDACRDMSGRRLRHVNAEKKLEEWKAEMEERKLEKMAEEFIKKKAKAIKKAGGSGNADKYVEKYREDSAKCMEEVERSVRESIASHLSSKRKAAADAGKGSEAKKFKIWMGKRKLGDSDSDSDDMDEDSNDEEENDKSVVTNNGNQSTSNKEGGESSDSVNGKLDAESSGAGSSESGSEDDKMVPKESLESNERLHGETIPDIGNIVNEPTLEIHEQNIAIPLPEEAPISGAEAKQTVKQEANITASGDEDGTVGHPPISSSSAELVDFSSGETALEGHPPISSSSAEGVDFSSGETDLEGNHRSESVVLEDTTVTSMNEPDIKKPLNFDEFSSAADMEVLGMEGLKSELQARGLKCGGTLQERAARLFLLKTTPLKKLPKKLLAKK